MLGLDELLSEFDDRMDYISRSKHEFFAANLRRWFALLEETPETAGLLQRLESSIDFEDWRKENLIEQSGMGHGRIVFPEDADQRLGVQISLFKSLTENEQAAWKFSHTYVSSESNLNDNIYDLVVQVFEPFARDLRRRISRELSAQTEVPAADRIVSPDHNTAEYEDAVDAVGKAQKAVREANDYPDPDDREQRLAELEAGATLLKAPRIRLHAIQEVLIKCLTYLAKEFTGKAIGALATAAVMALIALFGFG